MIRNMLRRRPIQLLLLGAIIFIIASAVPPNIINTMRPLKPGQSLTFTTERSETHSLAASHASDAVPEPNRDLPECAGPISFATPLRCFTIVAPSQQIIAVTTSETEESGAVSVESVSQIVIAGTVMAEIRNVAVVDALSVLPLPTPSAQMAISIPALSSGMATDPFIRDGMYLFFPFPTEQVSYPLFDTSLVDSVLVDFAGEDQVDGLDAFVFHHRVEGQALERSGANSIAMDSTIDGSLDFLSSTGFGDPYYAVDRTLWVEPETGTILDQHEEIHLYFASDDAEGSERAFEASPDHSIFHTNYAWDAETRAQQHDIAASQLSTLRWLQVFAVTLKAVALICVLIGVALLIRERRKA